MIADIPKSHYQRVTNMSELNSGLGLLVYVVFGSVGLGYFMYGRKQKMVVPLACGIGLMVYPYFVSNSVLLVVTGCILLGIPYFLRY